MNVASFTHWPGVIRKYAEHLPVTNDTPIITLLEGNTPLIPVPSFVEAIGGKFQLFLKYEGLNPTASFKDRGMTLAISKAKERGTDIVICASTGNTSASAAAYAARAKMKCVVLLPKGKIAQGKLAQALMHGAITLAIEGSFDDALRIVREWAKPERSRWSTRSIPCASKGRRRRRSRFATRWAMRRTFISFLLGTPGNITAYWKGYQNIKLRASRTPCPACMATSRRGRADCRWAPD
jgi:threonine synthase